VWDALRTFANLQRLTLSLAHADYIVIPQDEMDAFNERDLCMIFCILCDPHNIDFVVGFSLSR
jgi:hypothetical protein